MTKFVKGQTKDNAQRLLGAAEGLGLDRSVIRVTSGGFEVPDEVIEALESIKEPKSAPKPKAEETKPAPKPRAAAKKKEGEN